MEEITVLTRTPTWLQQSLEKEARPFPFNLTLSILGKIQLVIYQGRVCVV